MKRILIIGGSGFLGRALFKELHPYFDVYATYCNQERYANNKRYFEYDIQEDAPTAILKHIKPDIIISALRGDAAAQFIAHDMIISYAMQNEKRIIFLSSANVYDSFRHYPSYEHDKTLSESTYGKLKIKLENKILRMPPFSWTIGRIPMVFGSASPRLKEIKACIKMQNPYEVFPNTVINVAVDYLLTQQLHYIINKNLWGVFHLGSTDLIHHDEFIAEIVRGMESKYQLKYKHVYTSNNDRYIAVLPKFNKLPKHLNYTTKDVVKETLKNILSKQ